MKKIELFLLLCILLIGAWTRLYNFHNPIADWHSWRQADTSSVSRNFVKYGFDVLHPKFDDLSIGVSLLDNPHGYRFVEFPFYNILQASLFLMYDHFTLEEWGRIVSIVASLATMLVLYLLVRKYVSWRAGLFTAGFYAFAPYNIYYNRTLLPDTLMVAFMLGGLYFFDKWIDESAKQRLKALSFFVLSLLFSSAAVLMKPFVLFFALAYLCIAWNKYRWGMFKKKSLWLFLIISIVPFVLWRLWMLQYPEGIPQSSWLFNGTTIRFKGAFFQWLFADRISRLILGYYGLPFVIMGILPRIKKEGLLFLSMIVSSVLYMCVIATGNVHHDYYQILIIPTIAIFFGRGIDFILEKTKDIFNIYVAYVTILVSLFFMFAFSWFLVRDYYTLQHYNAFIVGQIADKLLPKDAKVIAPFGGDTSFLYYVNRQGWPVVDRPFYQFVKAGAEYIVFADPSGADIHLGTLFQTVEQGTNYIILDLTKPTKEGIQSMHDQANEKIKKK